MSLNHITNRVEQIKNHPEFRLKRKDENWIEYHERIEAMNELENQEGVDLIDLANKALRRVA